MIILYCILYLILGILIAGIHHRLAGNFWYYKWDNSYNRERDILSIIFLWPLTIFLIVVLFTLEYTVKFTKQTLLFGVACVVTLIDRIVKSQ